MLLADSHLRKDGVVHGFSKTLLQAISARLPSAELEPPQRRPVLFCSDGLPVWSLVSQVQFSA